MSDPAETRQRKRNPDLLRRIRDARRAFRYALTHDHDARERMFAPAHLLETLRKHVDHTTMGTNRERCGRLFVLAVVLYESLDWHFAGFGVDVEADVQIERARQSDRYGGRELEHALSANAWQTRMRQQIVLLEQQLAIEELYAARLVKLTALVQAALEAASDELQLE